MGVHVSPILNPLPTPSPSHPSGLSQCTPHLLLKVFLPHLFLGNMNLSISKVDSFSRSINEKIMVAMTGYFAFIHCYQVQPSHSQPSSLRALSLCCVHHGPTAQASFERLLLWFFTPIAWLSEFSLWLFILFPQGLS